MSGPGEEEKGARIPGWAVRGLVVLALVIGVPLVWGGSKRTAYKWQFIVVDAEGGPVWDAGVTLWKSASALHQVTDRGRRESSGRVLELATERQPGHFLFGSDDPGPWQVFIGSDLRPLPPVRMEVTAGEEQPQVHTVRLGPAVR